MDTIGHRLFELRKNKNITQEKLAENLSISRQSVSNWELDKSLPDMDKLMALATLYEVSLDYIVYGKQEETEAEEKKDYQANSINNSYANWYLGAIIACCVVLLIPMLTVFIGIMKHLPGNQNKMNSEIVAIDQVIEQYSLVEVSKLDNEYNYSKDRLWIDSRGVAEGDYIFTFTKPGKTADMRFEYYTKTMMLPFIGIILTFAIMTISIFLIIKNRVKTQ